MSWISDAHTDWHHANLDRPWDCPLDCGMAEARYNEWEDEQNYNDWLVLTYGYSAWESGMIPS